MPLLALSVSAPRATTPGGGSHLVPSHRFSVRDVLAGLSVALILIPQSMAYAELGGLPAYVGLYAAAAAPLAAAFFASSPYLQTGPTALTALLVLGALTPHATPGSAAFVSLAAMLAIMVGTVRLLVGLARAGSVTYLLSLPVLRGFTAAAGLLIIAGQIPGAVGLESAGQGVLAGAFGALSDPEAWHPAAVGMAVGTAALVLGGRRLHPLVPGVLLATVLGIGYAVLSGYDGPTVGTVPIGWPSIGTDLPWRSLPALFLPAGVIALVGFAEPASIAWAFASRERQRWDPDREFVSQGAANIASGLAGAFPVGGSFARSSMAHLLGATSRWSGGIAGLTVLAFLPFSSILEELPKAVLSGIVISAVFRFVRFAPITELWRFARPQAMVAWLTFGLTIGLAPHVEQALLVGMLLALAVHAWREMAYSSELTREGDALRLSIQGVLWFASVPRIEGDLLELLAAEHGVTRIEVDLRGLGRIDLSGAFLLRDFREAAERESVRVEFIHVPPHAHRILRRVVGWQPEAGASESDAAGSGPPPQPPASRG